MPIKLEESPTSLKIAVCLYLVSKILGPWESPRSAAAGYCIAATSTAQNLVHGGKNLVTKLFISKVTCM